MRRIMGIVFLALGLGLPLWHSAGADEVAGSDLQVGFGSRDITPKVGPSHKPVYLAGFGKDRKATGVNDPLHARAVVFRDGKNKVAIVSVDLVGLFLDVTERIRKQLPGFAHVVVTSTHNHEGPDTLGLWGPTPFKSGIDREYLAFVEKQVVEAVREADTASRPARGTIGQVKAPELLHDGRIPIVLHDDLVVLRIEDAKTNKTTGLVVQWNCHPETLGSGNPLVSTDYVGYTIKHLQEKYACPVVYITGTVGGLLTSLHVEIKNEKGESLRDGTYEKTARYGELLAQATIKALSAEKPVRLTPVVARRKEIFMPLTNRGFVVARQFGVLERETYLWKNAPEQPVLVKEIDDPKKAYGMRTEVGYLGLGELDVACIPGEIYPELVLGKVVEKAVPGADHPDAPIEPAIYDQLRGKYRMIIGLANDEIGYIIPKRQWDEKPPYAYDTPKPQYGEVNSLGVDTAPLLCEAFKELMASRK